MVNARTSLAPGMAFFVDRKASESILKERENKRAGRGPSPDWHPIRKR
jgi:hypothetical protein